MAKFCGKCGSKLDEATGLCPNCDAAKLTPPSIPANKSPKPAPAPKANQASGAKKPPSKKRLLSLVIGAGIVLVLAIVLLLLSGNPDDSYQVTGPDAQSYYEENARILSVTDAGKSKNNLTEAEVTSLLKARGFDQYAVEASYDMKGNLLESTEISPDSSDLHPLYNTFYVNSSEELWMVYVIDGKIMASPVSYNLQSEQDVQVTFSETREITSYDSNTNKFYVTIPDKAALIVKVVDRIDADTLDQLTIGGIDNYG